MHRGVIEMILLALASPAAAQLSTSGDAVLDAGMAACTRHATASSYDAGYGACDRVGRAWVSAAARFERKRADETTDAANYAGAEPPERRDLFLIERAVR